MTFYLNFFFLSSLTNHFIPLSKKFLLMINRYFKKIFNEFFGYRKFNNMKVEREVFIYICARECSFKVNYIKTILV